MYNTLQRSAKKHYWVFCVVNSVRMRSETIGRNETRAKNDSFLIMHFQVRVSDFCGVHLLFSLTFCAMSIDRFVIINYEKRKPIRLAMRYMLARWLWYN